MMMAPRQVSAKKQGVINYKAYKDAYIKLVKRNKPNIQKQAELEAELESVKKKLKKHNEDLGKIATQYDPDGDLVDKEDKREWESEVPDRITLKKEDRLKEIKRQLRDIADDELVTFPMVKRWLADKSKTNGPNDIKLLEKQTGIPADAWEKKDKKQTMTGENLESYCG